MDWIFRYSLAGLTALILSLIFTFLCKKIAWKFNFLDKPQDQDHKNHSDATPLLGGMAIFLSWVLTIFIGILVAKYSESFNHITENLIGIFSVLDNIIYIGIGALLAVSLGLFDDKFNMSAKVKLAGQILIAVIAVYLGEVKISLFLNIPILPDLISVFWILFVINAFNFFDNMDGLAVGTSTIATALFTIAAAINQQYFVATLGIVTTGATLGFWFYNYNPASIFMGDSGSHFLGFILAVLSINVTYYIPETTTSTIPILIPLFILAIPLFDTFAVTVIRLKNGKPIYIGDNNHISHRFVSMGMTRKKAVFFVHSLTLIIGLGVLPLIWGDIKTTILLVIQALAILFMISKLQYLIKEK